MSCCGEAFFVATNLYGCKLVTAMVLVMVLFTKNTYNGEIFHYIIVISSSQSDQLVWALSPRPKSVTVKTNKNITGYTIGLYFPFSPISTNHGFSIKSPTADVPCPFPLLLGRLPKIGNRVNAFFSCFKSGGFVPWAAVGGLNFAVNSSILDCTKPGFLSF